jgi:adenine-specific DNA-methyltransferase
MAFKLRYMGTKRQLAPIVADVLCSTQPGVILDIFSGMCAVGSEIGERRQVWNNDAQSFASTVADALFTSQELLPPLSATLELIFDDYKQNRSELERRFAALLDEEARAIKAESVTSLLRYGAKLSAEYLSPSTLRERTRLRGAPRTFPYRLFTNTYADSYFGLQQCIDIDSIRFAIDQALRRHRLNQDQRNWLLIALGQSMIRVANTTGHFAQYLELKEGNQKFYLRQRKKKLWEEFLEALADNSPIGSSRWRRGNQVFNEDSIDVLQSLAKRRDLPSAVFADAPYTNDQYSRYYHVLETLMKYDYPSVSGKGRYRHDRFRSAFSLKSQVAGAFDQLVNKCAALGSDIVLSYPTNGLLHQIGESPQRLLNRHYNRVEIAYDIDRHHSTFGASKGIVWAPVTERIYWARQ